MPTYHLAQVRYNLSSNESDPAKGMPCEEGILVHASDTHLLDFVLSVFNSRVQLDPDTFTSLADLTTTGFQT